jgi:hypothetical protein
MVFIDFSKLIINSSVVQYLSEKMEKASLLIMAKKRRFLCLVSGPQAKGNRICF